MYVSVSFKVRILLIHLCLLVCQCVFLCMSHQAAFLSRFLVSTKKLLDFLLLFQSQATKAWAPLLTTAEYRESDMHIYTHCKAEIRKKKEIKHNFQPYNLIIMPGLMVNAEISKDTNKPLYIQLEAPINWEDRHEQLFVLWVERHVIIGTQLL